MEQQYKKIHRVNVSTSVKKVKSYNCTIEIVDGTIEEVLAESDELVRQLDIRYPAPIEELKGKR